MPTLTDRTDEHRINRADFERIREAGSDLLRFELLDGEVLITPGCSPAHQLALMQLLMRLHESLPSGVEVIPGPFDVVLDNGARGDAVLQPDLLVMHRDDVKDDDTCIVVAPVLVAEVLSPITFRRDLGPKRDAYAAGGVEHYWVLAPELPSLTAYRLEASGGYREEAHVTGNQTWATTSPVETTLCPAELVR